MIMKTDGSLSALVKTKSIQVTCMLCGGVAGGGEHAGHCVLARPRVASLAASPDLLVSIAQQRHDLAILLLQVQQLRGQLVLGLLHSVDTMLLHVSSSTLDILSHDCRYEL